MAITAAEWQQIGSLIAQAARQAAREAVQDAIAGIASLGVAASAPYADPDGSGKTVVDVQIGNSTWPAVVVRSGETIAQGDKVVILMFGQAQSAAWLVLKA